MHHRPRPMVETNGDDLDFIPDEATLERAAEAVVFASSEPVSGHEIARTVADVTGAETPSEEAVADAIERLNARYEESGSALRIHRWSGGYRMATVPDVAAFLKAHFDPERQLRLTRSLMETLAILAYRQPVTKPEIDFVRGVDSDYAIRRLCEIGLVDVVGRSESVGRPLVYGTTPKFMDQFALESLDDLPKLREIEELLADPAFNQERAKLLAMEGLDRSAISEERDSRAESAGEDGDGRDDEEQADDSDVRLD